MKRKQKKYSKPQKPFDKIRIEEENVIKEKYGLKNKREIWKADSAIGRIRNLAKNLITKSEEEKKAFIERLQKKGFEVNSIADALALNKEDWLRRRLQTIVFSKKMTQTTKQARQLVVHKHVSIGNRIVNIPSYQVSLEEEPLVKLDIVLKTPKKKPKEEKVEEAESSEGEQVEEKPEEKKESVKEEKKVEESAEKAEVKEEVKEKPSEEPVKEGKEEIKVKEEKK